MFIIIIDNAISSITHAVGMWFAYCVLSYALFKVHAAITNEPIPYTCYRLLRYVIRHVIVPAARFFIAIAHAVIGATRVRLGH